jgi:predicted membrane protein
MEVQENQPIPNEDMWRKIEKSHRRGKIMGGLLIIAIGSLFLAREMGAIIPTWVFTWKMLLIGIGIVAAIKHRFLHPGWIVLVGIGGVFLLNDVYPDLAIRPYLWPVLIILVGLFIVFKPRNKELQHARRYWKAWHHKHHHGRDWHGKDWNRMRHQWQEARCGGEFVEGDGSETSEDYIDATNIFGGIKRNLLSKKFKGGTVVNIFGGAHINLTQADFEGTATLEITQVFGGTKLIVPANWEIKQSETVTICGGIEDKRPIQPAVSDENQRVLVLVGTTVFGGIEINSFS